MYDRWILGALLVVGACADDGGGTMGDATADASTTEAEGSSGVPGTSEGSTSGSSSDATGLDDGSDSSDSSGSPAAGVLAVGTFTIPAGATVEEFSFTAPFDGGATILSGETVVVAIRDLSHPRRDQTVLCPGNHPLDGCATVDYGAFGMTHDNRITFEGPRGPWAIHLFKDRSIQPEPEPLPVNE